MIVSIRSKSGRSAMEALSQSLLSTCLLLGTDTWKDGVGMERLRPPDTPEKSPNGEPPRSSLHRPGSCGRPHVPPAPAQSFVPQRPLGTRRPSGWQPSSGFDQAPSTEMNNERGCGGQ